MTVEERRAIREAIQPLGADWRFPLQGITLVCPACMSDEWMEGPSIQPMEMRTHLPNGAEMFHFRCPNCGGQVSAHFMLYDWGVYIPDNASAWN